MYSYYVSEIALKNLKRFLIKQLEVFLTIMEVHCNGSFWRLLHTTGDKKNDASAADKPAIKNDKMCTSSLLLIMTKLIPTCTQQTRA